MSNENGLSIIAPKSLAELQDLAKALAPASTLPQALRGKPAEVMLAIMTGAELGLSPMASIRGIHIIEGKPTLSADLMAGVVMGSALCEYLRCVETTAQVARYAAKRRGQEQVALSFSMQQAQAAGLAGRGNWAKFPDAMLRARACAAICRMVWPDLLAGVYDPDELARDAPPQVERQVNAPPITVAPPRPSPQDAAFVPASPPRRAAIVDETTGEVLPRKTMAEAVAAVEKAIHGAVKMTPWESIWAEAQARGMDEKALRAWLKAAGATSKNATTFDMVAQFVEAHPVESTPF